MAGYTLNMSLVIRNKLIYNLEPLNNQKKHVFGLLGEAGVPRENPHRELANTKGFIIILNIIPAV